MDVRETKFADEETTVKNMEQFKEKFVEQFRYKWKKYNKLLVKLKKMEAKGGLLRSLSTDSARDTPCDTPRDAADPPDEADGTIPEEAEAEAPADAEVAADAPADAPAEGGAQDDDVFSTTGTDAAEDGYMDAFMLTLRGKKVRRVISSSRDLEEDLLYSMVTETAAELAVAYEYQLGMLATGSDIDRVTKYGVQCIITSLQSRDSNFDSHSLVAAVLDADLKSSTFQRTKLKTIIPTESGSNVFWTVNGFYHKPGLRILKGSADVDRSSRQFEHCGCFSPWGSKCVPEVYGFRGPLYYHRTGDDTWEMIYNDRASICKHRSMREGIPEKHIDANREFHKTYKPFYVCRHNEAGEE